jgi:polyhydroxyalkanoate synthesis repressor PhaR
VDPSSHPSPDAVLIKRYANRKLYNTATSRYITLKGIAELIEAGEQVRVIDNETGEDITSVTLSQILVDTERASRRVPGTVLSDLIQRSGDVLYSALKRGVGDASEGIEEFQRNVRRLLGREGSRREWIAFAAPDLDRMVQRAVERVLRALDLPRRSDLEALENHIERLSELLTRSAPAGRTPRPDSAATGAEGPGPSNEAEASAPDLDDEDDDDASLDRGPFAGTPRS